MTAAMLREFMPYGAPDLQDAERPHLVRALALGSLLASSIFALAWSLSLVLVHPAAPPRVVSVAPIMLDPDVTILQPPPPPLAPPPIVKPSAAKPEAAIPQPVQDTPENLDRTIARQGETQGEVRGDVPGTVGITPTTPPVPTGPINEIDKPFFVDQIPTPVRIIKPDYPEMAKQAQVEGLVMVDVLVGKDGRVLEARLDRKNNVPILNESALEAARKWVFTPALVNNQPVMIWMKLPFRYTLHN